jgi:hypothetical protein
LHYFFRGAWRSFRRAGQRFRLQQNDPMTALTRPGHPRPEQIAIGGLAWLSVPVPGTVSWRVARSLFERKS